VLSSASFTAYTIIAIKDHGFSEEYFLETKQQLLRFSCIVWYCINNSCFPYLVEPSLVFCKKNLARFVLKFDAIFYYPTMQEKCKSCRFVSSI